MRLIELNEGAVVYSKEELRQRGFNLRELLYHGSFWQFDTFRKTDYKGTSKYLFVTPQRQVASAFGRFLYTCYGRPGKQADLTRDKKLAEKLIMAQLDTIMERDRYSIRAKTEKEQKKEAFTRGMYLLKIGALFSPSDNLADDVIADVFSMGYTSVRMFDKKPGISVVFKNHEDVNIIETEIRP